MPNCFPNGMYRFPLPPASCEGSYSSTSLSIFIIVHLLYYSHPLRGEVSALSLWVLICISLMTDDAENFFRCLLANDVSSLMKCLFRSLLPIKKVKLCIFRHSHAIIRNNTERSHAPCTPFPPVVTSSKTVDPWITQVWTAQVYLYLDIFSINMCYCTTLSMVH